MFEFFAQHPGIGIIFILSSLYFIQYLFALIFKIDIYRGFYDDNFELKNPYEKNNPDYIEKSEIQNEVERIDYEIYELDERIKYLEDKLNDLKPRIDLYKEQGNAREAEETEAETYSFKTEISHNKELIIKLKKELKKAIGSEGAHYNKTSDLFKK